MGTAIYKLSGKINFQVKKTHIPEGKYICHSYCRDLVHLDYPQNGKLTSCEPTGEVRHSCRKNPQIWDKIGGIHVHDCLSKVLNVASYQAHSLQLKVGHEVRMSVGRLHPIQNLISRGIRQSKGLPLTGS